MCPTPSRGLHRSTASCVLCVVFLVAYAAAAAPARAQDAPAHVAAADGAAWIDGEVDTVDAGPGEVVMAGDRVRTASGRVEIRLADGSTLALDDDTELELQSPILVRLTSGRLWLAVPRQASSLQSERRRIDTPLGSVVLREPGEYRVGLTTDTSLVDLVVHRGAAELTTPDGAVLVRSGERATAHLDGPPSQPMRFNTARRDAFDDWVASRHDTARGRAVSSQYLPDDLRSYAGQFDQYGSWDYEPSYGYVWYPAVDTGWRPYFNGYWRTLPTYGWTWIGRDPWGWPTHHYGRWGYAHSRWHWIPERHWGPAWVSWASAPDYVGWCPLGFDSRPVFGFSLSVGSTWTGWTVMSRSDFGRYRIPVARYAIDGGRLPRSVPFAVHGNAPLRPSSFQNRPVRSAAAPGAGEARSDDRRPRAVQRTGSIEERRGSVAAREMTIDTGIRAFRRDRRPTPETASPGAGQVPTRSGRDTPSTQSRSSSSASAPPASPRPLPPGIERGVPRARRPDLQGDANAHSDESRVYAEPARRRPEGPRPARDVSPPTAPPAANQGARSSARETAPQVATRPQGSSRAEPRRGPSDGSQSSDGGHGAGTRESGGGGGVHRRRP